MTDRGEYRSLYTALVDEEDFVSLSPTAKLVFYTLKLKLGASGIGVFYVSCLPDLGVCDPDAVPGVMAELTAGGDRAWVRTERNVVWIRNGLKNEPRLSLANENHRKSIGDYLRGLPKLRIVNDFAAYYNLALPFPEMVSPIPSVIPSMIPSPIPSPMASEHHPGSGERREEIGERKAAAACASVTTTEEQPAPTGPDASAVTMQAVAALNRGLIANPHVPYPKTVMGGQGSSFAAVAELLDEGIPADVVVATVEEKAASYRPSGRNKQINTVAYLANAIRERWDEMRTRDAAASGVPFQRDGGAAPVGVDGGATLGRIEEQQAAAAAAADADRAWAAEVGETWDTADDLTRKRIETAAAEDRRVVESRGGPGAARIARRVCLELLAAERGLPAPPVRSAA